MSKIIKGTVELIKTIAIVLIIAFLIKSYLIQTFIVEGTSMEPNFHTGEYLLVDKISYRLSKPKRGQIIVFIARKDDPSKDYIKRIIGLPGDSVKVNNLGTFINNQKLAEPYLRNDSNQDPMIESGQTNITLSDNEYFVLGDNRLNSRDSRTIGPIKSYDIIGRTFLIVMPFKNSGLVKIPNYPPISQSN